MPVNELSIQVKDTDQESVDKPKGFSGRNLYATYTIMALNIIVFILMAADGAGIINPNGFVHIKWGSNFGPLTLSGDWWRLITNMFIHFGIVHLTMNMYTLYIAGVYLEPLLERTRFIIAYLCTGILASITSLWWHNTPANSAGASGAIFGMFGLFLALLTTNIIPEQVRRSLLQSITLFIVYNLAFGMSGNIDNAAHVGGLLGGLVVGYLFFISINKERQHKKVLWILPLIIFLTAGIAFFYLQLHKSPVEKRSQLLREIQDSDFKDNGRFNIAYNQFIELQNNALAVFKDSSITDEAKIIRLKEISLPEWDKAELLAEKMQSYKVSREMHEKADIILQYIQLRKKEILVINDIIDKKVKGSQLGEVRNDINKVLEKLKSK